MVTHEQIMDVVMRDVKPGRSPEELQKALEEAGLSPYEVMKYGEVVAVAATGLFLEALKGEPPEVGQAVNEFHKLLKYMTASAFETGWRAHMRYGRESA